MRTRIIAVLATLILLLAYATTALAGDLGAVAHDFPDDPGVPSLSE